MDFITLLDTVGEGRVAALMGLLCGVVFGVAAQRSAFCLRAAAVEFGRGAMGPRVVFSTDLEIARRVCDQRMVAFTESVPPHVNMLWSEGAWTLGSMPIGSSGREWDSAIETVARLSGILHVLPPVSGRGDFDQAHHDPSRPHPREGGRGRPVVAQQVGGRRPTGRPPVRPGDSRG